MFGTVLSLSLYAPAVATCYCCVPHAAGLSPFSSAPRDKDVLISLTCPSLCCRGEGGSALSVVSPNICLLFPTSSSPDRSSTALCVGSRYSPLATSFYGYALGRIRGSPGSTVSPDVVFVSKGGNRAPGAGQEECVYDPFCLSPPALYGSIHIFLLLPHIP